MKKLINEPARFVSDALDGLLALDPTLRLAGGGTVIHRPARADAVAVISGGGSGHEPAHAGYVGDGLLTAALCSDVFTSPSTDAVLSAIRVMRDAKGVLLVVKNYTGDRLNFGLAAELARAEGVDVEMIVVDDDLALSADGDHAGRRGLAGTVLVHKVVGAAAASGCELAEVARFGREAIAMLGTIGVALSGCTLPGAIAPGFQLGDDEIEVGLGIHGERGIRRETMLSAASLVETIVADLVTGLRLTRGERVALLVNGLGGTTSAELLVVLREALGRLAEHGIVAERSWCGSFLTALEMQGCSISLLRLDDHRLALLDAPAQSAAWPGPGARRAGLLQMDRSDATAAGPAGEVPADGRDDAAFRRVLTGICTALRDAEPELTRLDQQAGDGDLGFSLKRAAAAIEDALPGYDLVDPRAALTGIAATVRRAIGGTSGPLYAVLLLRAASRFAAEHERHDPARWSEALEAGWRGLAELGDSRPGDRTMIDALAPASKAFQRALDAGSGASSALKAAAEAARAGAQATAGMAARRGRSSYLADRVAGVPDPGAVAVACWIQAILGALDADHRE